MALQLIGKDLNSVFQGRGVCALNPPRNDVQIGAILTRTNLPNPKRTSVKEIARNEINLRALDISPSMLGHADIGWRVQDEAALEGMVGVDMAKVVRGKIKAEAQERKILNVKLQLRDMIYYTTDILAAISEVESLQITFNQFAQNRFYFVDSIVQASGMHIEVECESAGSINVQVAASDVTNTASGVAGVKASASTERAAFVGYDFPHPLTIYYSALEVKREGLGRGWKVQKKDKLLSLSGDADRVIQAISWMEPDEEGGTIDVTPAD